MGIIAWIVLGLAAGFNVSTWLTAIAGAFFLLVVYHLIAGRSGRFAHR
jgi:uncharacterized membrane protein YeaQ/YmgE (transglycosylase-associated protein family)